MSFSKVSELKSAYKKPSGMRRIYTNHMVLQECIVLRILMRIGIQFSSTIISDLEILDKLIVASISSYRRYAFANIVQVGLQTDEPA